MKTTLYFVKYLKIGVFLIAISMQSCASDEQKACSNLERLAEENTTSVCEDFFFLAEQCPSYRQQMFECAAKAKDQAGIGECLGECILEQLQPE